MVDSLAVELLMADSLTVVLLSTVADSLLLAASLTAELLLTVDSLVLLLVSVAAVDCSVAAETVAAVQVLVDKVLCGL